MNKLSIMNDGYVHCRSTFYSVHDILNRSKFTFSIGINKLIGEIDSGNWAVSYLLSMYKHRPKDFVLFEEPRVFVSNEYVSLNEFSKHTCYMDQTYPLFSTKVSIKKLVTQGLKHSKTNLSINDIKSLFYLDDNRFERPLTDAGNEIFRAMAAVALAYNVEVFCFPWLSKMRFDSYHENLTLLLKILDSLGKIVILPLNQQ